MVGKNSNKYWFLTLYKAPSCNLEWVKIKNAINLNDKLLSQGYASGFGFSSEKVLFYVYISVQQSAEEARRVRDDIRKIPAYKDAWYLLVNE